MSNLDPVQPTDLASIKPADHFDSDKAAEGLRKAMKGLGTNEDAIIQILTGHCNAQRLEIDKKYTKLYSRDLRSDLKSEISGKFLTLALAVLEHPRVFDAMECNEAMKGACVDEETLIEILSTRTNPEIAEMCKQYRTMYKRDMERDIHADDSGDFQDLLKSLVTGKREERPVADLELAKKEAKELQQEAGEMALGTEESRFQSLLCQRSVAQLVETFRQYQAISGHELEQDILTEMTGNLQAGFLSIVKAIKNPAFFFAEKLFKCMKGAGTNDRTLVRVIVSRSEVDMATIKEEFHKAYNKTLADYIRDDTIGDYRKMLVALVKD